MSLLQGSLSIGAMGNYDSDSSDFAQAPQSGRLLRLSLFCLAVALTVVVIVLVMTPPDDTDPTTTSGGGPAEEVAVAAASVTLATAPLQVPNEQLQTELIDELEALQTRFPRDSRTLHVAAGAYAKIHQTGKATELWKKCIELDPQQPGPRLGLAILMSEKGEDAQAIEMLKSALADGCSSAELYYRLATAQSKVGEIEEAESVMKAAVEAFPRVAINWLLLGQTQNQLQKFEEAERSLRKSIELGNRSSEVYFALFNACQRQGKAELAAEYRKRFSELKAEEAESKQDKPFQEIYQQALRPIVVGSFAAAAAIYAEYDGIEKAEQLFLRANALEPENRQVLEELVTMYRKQDRIADARVVQQRLVELEPTNVIYLVNLASVASQLEDYPAAESALEEARRLRPDYALPHIGLAQLRLQVGNLEQARGHAEAAVRCAPTNQTFTLLAIICQQQGDTQAAESALRAAARLQPVPPQAP